ncbi:MAG: phosphoribosylformylglycinamidine synthase subunit PurS [Bacteroidota bacterium]
MDPQGKAVSQGLKNMGLSSLDNVRIGKHITVEVEADSRDQANESVDEACKKLLSNPIMESYRFILEEAGA